MSHSPKGEKGAFVSRAGEKIDAAIAAFGIDCAGLRCADFGCNVGGFTDCMLRRGAARVIAVDTGYGALAWTLRTDARVEVRERTNALHAEPPAGGVDLVTIDLAWTPQRLAIPAALRWLAEGGRILTLVKPHYEVEGEEKAWLDKGFLPQDKAPIILERVLGTFPALGARVLRSMPSPLVGGKTSKRLGVPGNVEYVALAMRA